MRRLTITTWKNDEGYGAQCLVGQPYVVTIVCNASTELEAKNRIKKITELIKDDYKKRNGK